MRARMSSTLTQLLRPAPLLVALLGGCATTTTTFTALNTPPRALKARPSDQVEVFSAGAPPLRPYVDVGLITAEEGYGDETPATLIGLMLGVAAERGCDAMLIAPPGSKSHSMWIGGTRTFKTYSATCLVYGIAAPRAAAPAPLTSNRRTCRDRRDFDENRNCVLAAPSP